MAQADENRTMRQEIFIQRRPLRPARSSRPSRAENPAADNWAAMVTVFTVATRALASCKSTQVTTPAGGPTVSNTLNKPQAFGPFRDILANCNPDWTEGQVLKAAVAAYNTGPGCDLCGRHGPPHHWERLLQRHLGSGHTTRFFNETLPTVNRTSSLRRRFIGQHVGA